MLLRGVPSALDTTIGLHHVTGEPIWTGAMIPLSTSWSRLSLTFTFQSCGIGMGVWRASATAPGFKWILAGRPDKDGNGGELLKELLANCSQW